MCGIAGVLRFGSSSPNRLSEIAESMGKCLVHRGPDDSGVWSDDEAGVALSFRRLAILDLSAAGHQPMRSATGRFMIVFNGEVYNYLEIRKELETFGVTFRGSSDTEVILASFEQWGIEKAVGRFIGMFAIGAWDAKRRTLSLIRDRLGIKPVYYSLQNGLLTFGSELKALVAVPHFDHAIDADALDAYLRYLYVPAPLTMYKHAKKLRPGHILTVDASLNAIPESVAYWSLEAAYAAGTAAPFQGNDDEVVSALRSLLSDAVSLRMRSDVPMGALLSGGIDSSTVVALMQANASQPTQTFSIGFPGTVHDEASDAARIAEVLGTQHTPMNVTGEDALAVIPSLARMYDEPFADPSQIPTYLVSKLARQSVTVALSGDGGDEVFAGYERYLQGERLIGTLAKVPRSARRLAGAAIGLSSASRVDQIVGLMRTPGSGAGRRRLVGQKVRKLARLLGEDTSADMYRSLMSVGWPDSSVAMLRKRTGVTEIEELLAKHADLPMLDRMMLTDQQTYLTDDLLAKVDRASMAVSLEARVPLLDHRVIEFGWRLQRHHKIRDGRGKWALRQVLYQFVDAGLVDRPKTGFSVPLASWLRGPLKEWASDLLFGADCSQDDWLSVEGVRAAWTNLQAGGDEFALAIWSVLMFQAWRHEWL